MRSLDFGKSLRASRKKASIARACKYGAMIEACLEAGMTKEDIAMKFTREGVSAAKGAGAWSPASVTYYLRRYRGYCDREKRD